MLARFWGINESVSGGNYVAIDGTVSTYTVVKRSQGPSPEMIQWLQTKGWQAHKDPEQEVFFTNGDVQQRTLPEVFLEEVNFDNEGEAPVITCPACLGRRRKHTKDRGCKLFSEAVSYTHLTLPTICSV